MKNYLYGVVFIFSILLFFQSCATTNSKKTASDKEPFKHVSPSSLDQYGIKEKPEKSLDLDETKKNIEPNADIVASIPDDSNTVDIIVDDKTQEPKENTIQDFEDGVVFADSNIHDADGITENDIPKKNTDTNEQKLEFKDSNKDTPGNVSKPLSNNNIEKNKTPQVSKSKLKPINEQNQIVDQSSSEKNIATEKKEEISGLDQNHELFDVPDSLTNKMDANDIYEQNYDETNIDNSEKTQFSDFPDKEDIEEDKFNISRKVKIHKNQRLKVLYPGEKWVYLGEESSQKGLKYEQRKFKDGDTEFTFYADKIGNYILHFSRFDVYSDDFISDGLAVAVSEKVSSAPAVMQAPAYTLPVPESVVAEIDSMDTHEQKNAMEPTTGIKTPAHKSTPKKIKNANIVNPADDLVIHSEKKNSDIHTEDLLAKARDEISKGKGKEAIQTLEDFFAISSSNLDEGLLLKGKAYEINGPAKNIKEALKSYKSLVRSFPNSEYWNAADERIRYIKRFFVNIE